MGMRSTCNRSERLAFDAGTCYGPRMPGSGPIDPDKILEAILDNGADWAADHLVLNGPQWLRVEGNAWELSTTEDVLISRETFDALQTADRTPVANCIRIGGSLFTLDEDEIEGRAFAVLNPA